MHVSQSEAYSNHTNFIQEIQHISIQSCNTHDSCCRIFIATNTELIKNGIFIPMSPPSLPQSTRGISARYFHSLLVTTLRSWWWCVFLWFLCFLPHSQCYLTTAFFNWIVIPSMVQHPLPQPTRQTRAFRCHPPLQVMWRRQQLWVFLSFLFPHFLTESLSKYIAIHSAVPAFFPQSTRQVRACSYYPPLASHVEKAVTVRFPLLHTFPHCSKLFLPFSFSN